MSKCKAISMTRKDISAPVLSFCQKALTVRVGYVSGKVCGTDIRSRTILDAGRFLCVISVLRALRDIMTLI